jgi:hypothetical protein
MLDPVTPPVEARSMQTNIRAGHTLLHGYAVDDQGRSVSGVLVRLKKANVQTTTDGRGYYELLAATPPNSKRHSRHRHFDRRKARYKTIVHANIFIAGGDGGGMFLDMKSGSGLDKFDDTHKLLK